MSSSNHVLTINSGSSSLKFSLYAMGRGESLLISGVMDRIGLNGGHFRAADGGGKELVDRYHDFPDHDAALQQLFEWLGKQGPDSQPQAVGHRLVYGGRRYTEPQLVTLDLLAALGQLIAFAPEHLPHELKAIHAVKHILPDLAQVACFDTAFHASMPKIAKMYPLAKRYQHAGVERYGFHGLSYSYIMRELSREAGREVANGRVIIAHLGNGASMAAVNEGKPVDTTMGLTPTGGLMMGTRSGDLDPGVVLYLLEENGMPTGAVRELLNRYSGLLGVSGVSSDMRDLLGRETAEPGAAEAVTLFCYQAKKYLGALIAVLGGLDTLVFTAGIGENAPAIRQRICDGLDYLGVRLDPERNTANAHVISADSGRVTVRVIKTDEEIMIARHTYEVISGGGR